LIIGEAEFSNLKEHNPAPRKPYQKDAKAENPHFCSNVDIEAMGMVVSTEASIFVSINEAEVARADPK
jgi:hypothetical protein